MSPVDDYRGSHVGRGEDYDAALNEEPFDRYMAEREAALLRRIVARDFGGKIPRYLDFACGTGRITSIIEILAAESHAVDVSSSMLEIAQRKCHNTRFHVLDVTRASADLPQMDLITAFRFFGNAQQDLRVEVLRALKRYLAPRGYLVFNNHRNPSSLLGGDTTLDLSRARMLGLLRDSGFRAVRIYGIGAWIIRHRIMSNGPLLRSRFAKLIEPVSLLPGLGPFCPDMIVVAQRDME
jgi:SAM-dependent methyltransferase